MSVYALSGVTGGIAVFISICNLGNAISGGTNMNGGEGSITRTVIGAMLIAILTNGLNLIGIPFYDQLIIEDCLIFIGNSLATGISAKSSMAME